MINNRGGMQQSNRMVSINLSMHQLSTSTSICTLVRVTQDLSRVVFKKIDVWIDSNLCLRLEFISHIWSIISSRYPYIQIIRSRVNTNKDAVLSMEERKIVAPSTSANLRKNYSRKNRRNLGGIIKGRERSKIQI